MEKRTKQNLMVAITSVFLTLLIDTLIAALIGGKLFGIMGIIFFIPLTAVVIEFVKEDAGERMRRKNIDSHRIL